MAAEFSRCFQRKRPWELAKNRRKLGFQEDKDSNLPETSKSSFSKSSFGLDKTFSFKAGWGALWIFAAIHAILTKNAQNYCGWLISSVWKQTQSRQCKWCFLPHPPEFRAGARMTGTCPESSAGRRIFSSEGILHWKDVGSHFFSTKITWLVVWNMNFIVPYIGNSNRNWLSYFSEGWLNHQPVTYFYDVRSTSHDEAAPLDVQQYHGMPLRLFIIGRIPTVKSC